MANDIFDELLNPTAVGTPLAPDLIAALRKKRELGQIASLSGDKNIARLGGAEYDDSMKSATDLRDQRYRAAKDKDEAAFVEWQKKQKELERSDTAAYRRASLENQKGLINARIAASNAKGPPLSPFDKKYQETLARDASSWDQTGSTQASADLNNLKQVAADIGDPDTEIGNSRTTMLPEWAQAVTNPKGLEVQRRVNRVTVENLRNTFGPQFTEKEGVAFKALDYDPALKDEVNLKNVQGKIAIIENLIAKKNALFDQYRTDNTPQTDLGGGFDVGTASDAALLKALTAGDQ